MTSCTSCKGLGWRLRSLEQGGTETEIDLGFIATDWRGSNLLKVIPDGIPSNNEIGPHGLLPGTYNVNVYKYIDNGIVKETDLVIIINRNTGLISMFKAGKVIPFSGRIVINYAKVG